MSEIRLFVTLICLSVFVGILPTAGCSYTVTVYDFRIGNFDDREAAEAERPAVEELLGVTTKTFKDWSGKYTLINIRPPMTIFVWKSKQEALKELQQRFKCRIIPRDWPVEQVRHEKGEVPETTLDKVFERLDTMDEVKSENIESLPGYYIEFSGFENLKQAQALRIQLLLAGESNVFVRASNLTVLYGPFTGKAESEEEIAARSNLTLAANRARIVKNPEPFRLLDFTQKRTESQMLAAIPQPATHGGKLDWSILDDAIQFIHQYPDSEQIDTIHFLLGRELYMLYFDGFAERSDEENVRLLLEIRKHYELVLENPEGSQWATEAGYHLGLTRHKFFRHQNGHGLPYWELKAAVEIMDEANKNQTFSIEEALNQLDFYITYARDHELNWRVKVRDRMVEFFKTYPKLPEDKVPMAGSFSTWTCVNNRAMADAQAIKYYLDTIAMTSDTDSSRRLRAESFHELARSYAGNYQPERALATFLKALDNYTEEDCPWTDINYIQRVLWIFPGDLRHKDPASARILKNFLIKRYPDPDNPKRARYFR